MLKWLIVLAAKRYNQKRTSKRLMMLMPVNRPKVPPEKANWFKSPSSSWLDQVLDYVFDSVNFFSFHTYIRNDICISYSLLFLNSVDNLSSNLKLDNCQLSCVVNANINIINILAIHCLLISSYKFWWKSFCTRCPLFYIGAFLFAKGLSINSCRWYWIRISVIINWKNSFVLFISTYVSVATKLHIVPCCRTFIRAIFTTIFENGGICHERHKAIPPKSIANWHWSIQMRIIPGHTLTFIRSNFKLTFKLAITLSIFPR